MKLPPLPKDFVRGNADGGRQVQRPHVGRDHRHADEAIAVAIVEVGGQAAGFPSEHEHDVLRSSERNIPERSRGASGEKIRLTERREHAFKRRPIGPHSQVDVFPIVEARALYLSVVE